MDQFNQIDFISLAIIILGFITITLFLCRQISVFGDSEEFSIPDDIPLSGIEIPAIATFSGIKNLTYLTIGENRINPKLVLYDDHLEYRILTLKRADYSQIESAQEISFLFHNYFKINFYDRSFSFSVRLANSEVMHKVSDFFLARGIPVKTSRR